MRRLTFQEDIEVLKFLAQYPFKEIVFKEDNGDLYPIQIVAVHYASQEVTLRDFNQYTVKEIILSEGFCEDEIQMKWINFLTTQLGLTKAPTNGLLPANLE